MPTRTWLVLGLVVWVAVGVVTAQRPVGVHLDIEPHGHAEWKAGGDRQTKLATEYLEMLRAVKKELDGKLPLTIDVAFVYSEYELSFGGTRATLLEHALGIVDRAVLMDYRDHAVTCHDGRAECPESDSIISHGANALQIAADSGHAKKIVLGVETNPDLDAVGASKVTFGDDGEAAMELAFQETIKTFQSDALFEGVAVHDFVHASAASFLDETGVAVVLKGALRPCRSLWMWDSDTVVEKGDKKASTFYQYAVAHGVATVWVDSYWLFESLRPKFEAFINENFKRHIGVEFLFGNPDWSNQPDIVVDLAKKSVAMWESLPAKALGVPTHCAAIRGSEGSPGGDGEGDAAGDGGEGTGSSGEGGAEPADSDDDAAAGDTGGSTAKGGDIDGGGNTGGRMAPNTVTLAAGALVLATACFL